MRAGDILIVTDEASDEYSLEVGSLVEIAWKDGNSGGLVSMFGEKAYAGTIEFNLFKKVFELGMVNDVVTDLLARGHEIKSINVETEDGYTISISSNKK